MVGNDYLEKKTRLNGGTWKSPLEKLGILAEHMTTSHNEIIFTEASKQVSALNSIDYLAQDQFLQRLLAEHMWLYLAKPWGGWEDSPVSN